jgi:hypothetical protein
MKLASFEFIHAHPWQALETFAIYKPLNIYQELRTFLAVLLRDLLFTKLAVLILMAAAIGVFAPPQSLVGGSGALRLSGVITIVALCLGASTIPLIVAYPDDFLISDPAFLATTGLLLCLIWGVAKERSWARARGSKNLERSLPSAP